MYLSDVILTSAEATASATAESTLSVGERISEGFSTSLLGMVTIFVMLTVIFIMMKLMSAIFSGSGKSGESADPVTLPAKDPAPVAVAPTEDEEETVAAIVAAISAYTNQSPSSFRVVSFKRVYFN